MGWDVEEIGLKHDLPVNDPFATAQEVAKRMNRNIRLVYRNEYEYDIENNVVSEAKGPDIIELGKYEVNDSRDYLEMRVSNYQAHQIEKLVGLDKLRKASFSSEFAELIIDDIEDSFELYEIEGQKDNTYIRIFKENINLDAYVIERWRTWEYAFHQSSSYREWLRNYRMEIYNQAKMFGCKEVIICPDQGPAMEIGENAHYPADQLKEYAQSFQYLKDTTWIDESEKEEWKKHAKHIMFSSYFKNQLNLSDGDFVEVIYDDFSDIDNRKRC